MKMFWKMSSERFYKYHSVSVIMAPSPVTLLNAYAVIRSTPSPPRSMFTRLLGQLLPPLRQQCAKMSYTHPGLLTCISATWVSKTVGMCTSGNSSRLKVTSSDVFPQPPSPTTTSLYRSRCRSTPSAAAAAAVVAAVEQLAALPSVLRHILPRIFIVFARDDFYSLHWSPREITSRPN